MKQLIFALIILSSCASENEQKNNCNQYKMKPGEKFVFTKDNIPRELNFDNSQTVYYYTGIDSIVITYYGGCDK